MSDKNRNILNGENIRLGDGEIGQSDNPGNQENPDPGLVVTPVETPGLHVILHAKDTTRNNVPLYPKNMDTDVHIKSRNGFTTYDTLDEVLDDLSDLAFLNSLNVTYDSATETVTFS